MCFLLKNYHKLIICFIFQHNLLTRENYGVRYITNGRCLQCPSCHKQIVSNMDKYTTIRVNGIHTNHQHESMYSRLYQIDHIINFNNTVITSEDGSISCKNCDRTLGFKTGYWFLHTVNEIVSITDSQRVTMDDDEQWE